MMRSVKQLGLSTGFFKMAANSDGTISTTVNAPFILLTFLCALFTRGDSFMSRAKTAAKRLAALNMTVQTAATLYLVKQIKDKGYERVTEESAAGYAAMMKLLGMTGGSMKALMPEVHAAMKAAYESTARLMYRIASLLGKTVKSSRKLLIRELKLPSNASDTDIRKRLVKEHPDKGGENERMIYLNQLWKDVRAGGTTYAPWGRSAIHEERTVR